MALLTVDNQEQTSTCASCPYFQAHNDGTNKGWCQLFNQFARTTHQQTQDCINTIADEQQAAQTELEQHVEAQAQEIAPALQIIQAVQTQLPQIKIDSVEHNSLGTVYRLWNSYHFLGSFYQIDEQWIAEPANTRCVSECDTEYQAQLVILAINGLVVPVINKPQTALPVAA